MATMLADTWFSRDLPVLEAAVELFDAGGEPVTDSLLTERTGIPKEDVRRALRGLEHEHLELSWDMRATMVASVKVVDCFNLARRETGQWPNAESLTDRALAIVDERIDSAGSEDERSRWVKLRDGIGGASRDLMVDVMGAVVSRQVLGG